MFVVGDIHRPLLQDCFVDVMATGNSQPGLTARESTSVRVHVHIPWNTPESFVTLDSTGVFVLDTACVSNVLGLRTRYTYGEPVKVLLGRARESI